MNRALTPAEVKSIYNQMTGGNINIINYDKIIKARSLDSIFKRFNNCFILFYPFGQGGGTTYGHYVAIVRNPKNQINFYDPLGDAPDEYKKDSPQRDQLYIENVNSLVHLLLKKLNKGYNIDYSHHIHQSKNPNTATCGRHALMRCIFNNLTNEEYHDLMKSIKKEMNPKIKGDKYMDKLIFELTKKYGEI